MKIVHLSTGDILGGAPRASHRLHRGLLQAGQDSLMLVRYKHSTDDSVIQVVPEEHGEEIEWAAFLGGAVQKQYIDANRTGLSDTIFSFPYQGYDLSNSPQVRQANLINLHWVAYYQSPTTLRKLFDLGKPVVWTLHDQWPFTGGCHYSTGCDKYRHDCADCPQLADDPFQLPRAVLEDKLALFQGADLSIVTPSKWLADCARASKLFKNLRVEAISNALDIETLAPLPKAQAKEGLGLDPKINTVLFVAQRRSEGRKGFEHLAAALAHCLETAEFRKLVDSSKVALLCLGGPGEQLLELGLPTVSLGYINSDEEIRRAYAAADVFVLPSLEDNLPNTMLEAMSCGTPVVAYDAGGIPEVVISDVTGELVPVGDTRGLAEGMLSLLFNADRRKAMGRNCRTMMEEGYSLPVQARRYTDLYQELCHNHGSSDAILPQATETEAAGTGPNDREPIAASQLVVLNTTLGAHVGAIHDQVLLRALREFIPARERQHVATVQRLKEENTNLRQHQADLRNSISWRMTKPLRAVSRGLRKLKR